MASARGQDPMKVSSLPGSRAGGSAQALAPARAVVGEMDDEGRMVWRRAKRRLPVQPSWPCRPLSEDLLALHDSGLDHREPRTE